MDLVSAEEQLNKLLDRRAAKGREARPGQEFANQEAERLKAEEARKLQEMREQNRTLWAHHFRRLAYASLQDARDYRRRARALEAGE